MPMYQPNVTNQSLAQLDKVPLYSFVDALRAQEAAQQADQMSLADLPGQIAHQQRLRPLAIEQQTLANQTAEAQLPGLQAQASMLQRKDKADQMTFDPRIKAELAKFALEHDKNEIEQLGVQAEKLMMSGDPVKVKQGRQMFMASKEMFKLRQEHDWKMEVIRQQGANSAGVANINADARLKAAELQARFKRELASLGNDPKKLVGHYAQKLLLASPEEKAQAQAEYEFAVKTAQSLNPPVAPGINPERTNGALVTPPPPTPPKAPGVQGTRKPLGEY